jgi:hypothetical protein
MVLRPEPLLSTRPKVRSAWSAWLRIIRPRDLLALDASWRGMVIERPGGGERGGPVLIASAKGGLLRFRFAYQHMAEAAVFEAPPPLTAAVPVSITPPVGARGAKDSRLVFKVPAGEKIDYSVAGLLDAMLRLELAVVPAATPSAVTSWFLQMAESEVASTLISRLFANAGEREIGVTRLAPELATGAEGQRAMVAANRLRANGALDFVDFSAAVAAAPSAIAGGRLTATAPGVQLKWKLPEIRKPRDDETAIEAPFRLILSPSTLGGWVHATIPQTRGTAVERTELWHTRLAVRDSEGRTDENKSGERIVRAIWTRDDEGLADLTFRNSLTAADRIRIVRQSAGTPLAPKVRPRAAQVKRLALSSLGAWVDVRARWDFERYIKAFMHEPEELLKPLSTWEHVAPMGRDQYVRIDTPGYLYPLGHAAVLVKITYRQIVGATKPQAALFQKQYIVLSEPQKNFSRRDFPFVSARLSPDRTPDLNEVVRGTPPFWPIPQGQANAFEWKIEAIDQDGAPIHLQAPLVFVPVDGNLDSNQAARDVVINRYREIYDATAKGIPADGQTIAFAPALATGEGNPEARANAGVERLLLGGEPNATTATPFLHGASVVIPAIKRLTPSAAVNEVIYPDVYRTHGFAAANAGNVFLELAEISNVAAPPIRGPIQLAFGSAERSGGFIRPDVVVAGLARSTGLVSDIGEAAQGKFDPNKLFGDLGGALPKLFGLISIADIIQTVGGKDILDFAPKFVTEAMDKISGLIADLNALKKAVTEYSILPSAIIAEIDQVQAAITELLEGDADAIGLAKAEAALEKVKTTIKDLKEDVAKLPNDPLLRSTFDKLFAAIIPALDAADTIIEVKNFANGIATGGGDFRTKFDWRPVVRDWPESGPIFKVDDANKALVVSVEARTAGGLPSGFEIAAQLSNFQFNLVPGFELMEVQFERIAFRASGARKPEIDIVFKDLKFVGVLSFVEVLKDLIPLDGFSDPPFVDVSTAGISAGFTVALPNLAIGLFSLTNISLGADARVPFLGDVVSVGFNFCTRERPFTLAVAFLGGGGFLGIRLSPDGLILLEGALEFGAVVALDFGVASGSVSVMAGIYFKIEGDDGQLTGYVRIRGEVDVLSLISASLELYLALSYYTKQGKLIGEAKMTIKVEVLFFSASVSVTAKRTFAGSNGDPTVRQMLLIDSRGDAIWDEYLAAFAPARAEG